MNTLLAAGRSQSVGEISQAWSSLNWFTLSNAGAVFNNIISVSIAIITVVAGIWFISILITGAVGLIGSGGDKAAVEEARRKITTGFIGLVVVVAGIFIVDLIGKIFGIDIRNPGEVLMGLRP